MPDPGPTSGQGQNRLAEADSLSIDRICLSPGEEIRWELRLSSEAERSRKVTNLNVDVFRLQAERNHFAFGFGTEPEKVGDAAVVVNSIPESIKPGLYAVLSFKVAFDGDAELEVRPLREPLVFAVLGSGEEPVSRRELEERLAHLSQERLEYEQRLIKTPAAVETPEEAGYFSVLVFGVGCLLHSEQQLEGHRITPLRTGLSHSPMHEVVSGYLERLGVGTLDLDESTEARFRHSTPTFVITFARVQATDWNDAVQHCLERADCLFLLLGIDRGQLPSQFCSLAIDLASGQLWYGYSFPGYRGNLLSDFDSASTASRIEQLLPKLEKSPWAELLVRNFVQATAETKYDIKLWRYWSVLETVAKDRVARSETVLLHPDGGPILRPNSGEPHKAEDTLGRVYQYILGRGAYRQHGTYKEDGQERRYLVGVDKSDPAYTSDTELITVWDLLSAIYEVRCAVAHEGSFDRRKAAEGRPRERLAAEFLARGHPDLLAACRSKAEQALFDALRDV